MFKKYYKEAMDDIKPDEAFVMSVIEKAKKRQPPVYTRYAKYAAAAAAAVVVVSGTVISMPLWQRVTDSTDGVIIEETITDNTADKAESKAAVPAVSPLSTAAPKGVTSSVNSSENQPVPTQIPSQNTSIRSYSALGEDAAKTELPEEPAEEAFPVTQTDTAQEDAEETQLTPDSGGAADQGNTEISEEPMLKRAVLGEADTEPKVNSAPQDMAPYGEAYDASESAAAKMAAIEDSDIPTPAGYYCTSAAPNGYTFVNDESAVITVMINYGGEEREPYIEEDGDNIYAVFTSFGLSVTINASGADRSAVEEIINSLR